MINKAFVINLDSKQEQFHEVKQAFEPYGIECERFSAITHQEKKVGASLSFLSLIAKAKKEKAPWIMIFEDDCVPRPAMKEWPAISQYLIKNKKHWDVFLGGAGYIWPKVLRNDFKTEKTIPVDIIECCYAVLSHFAIFNESSYDELLKWHDLSLPPGKRPVIDVFMGERFSRIWVSSPNIAWQKIHSGTDLTDLFLTTEKKLKYFSEQIKKSKKARLLGRWLRTIS